MKIHLMPFKAVILGLLIPTLGVAQADAPRDQQALPPQAPSQVRPTAPAKLTRFSLDFPGGTPQELVNAIERASGKPLNVIVLARDAGWKLPPLKMANVSVLDLFRAIEQASSGAYNIPWGQGRYGFRTTANPPDINDETVWTFYQMADPNMEQTRFYFLKPYLDAGLTVDDITTAIKTGWKMRSDSTEPRLSYHKETNLLIAVGDQYGLNVINAALQSLEPLIHKTPTPPPAPANKS